jgi:hypothetical protein
MKGKRDKRKDSIELDELRELSDPVPAKEWVNLLFMHMFKTHLESFTLKKSEGIPPIPLEDELPEGELDFNKIINRLKVMSGLDPTTFKKTYEGNIRMCVHGIWCTVKTTFVDSDDDSKCEITISKETT